MTIHEVKQARCEVTTRLARLREEALVHPDSDRRKQLADEVVIAEAFLIACDRAITIA